MSAHEACIRGAKVVPGFSYSKTDQRLFDARNAGAHLAVTNSELAREAAQIMVRLVESLIRYAEIDRHIFWGDMVAAADSLLDEKASRVSAAVDMKIAVAKRRLETRLEGLGADNRALVLKTLGGRSSYSEDEEPEECPACGQTAIVYCELHDTGSPDFNYEQVDVDEFFVTGYIDRIAYAIQLWCPACFLELDYEEMTAADLVTEYPREPRQCDPGEFEWDDGRD